MQRIAYTLSMPAPSSHLFGVRVDVQIPAGAPQTFIDFQMPRWSPGRYSIADFAKNVQEFGARAGNGDALRSMRIDDQTWRVQAAGQRNVTASYKVYGNDLSGTFGQLDAGHASYNGGEVFMYVAGHKADPVDLRINPPAGWRIINGRMDRPDQREWRFENYDLLIDTPTEIGPDWTADEFRVDGKLYRVMVHSRGDEAGRRPALVQDIEKIVRAETAMWGSPDFNTYTFLIHYAADGRSGDGMEHLTSTQIVESGALSEPGQYESTLDTVSHEFFHVWNVKRLRPAELGPWEFTRPVATRGLWIAEGLTNYYGYLMQRRAGIWDDARLYRRYAGTMNNIENAAGSRLMSAEDASMAAPFTDASLHRQRTNLAQTSISYYTKGELLGLTLDLWIRGKSNGRRSLDDVLRRAYDVYYVESPKNTYYLKGRGYSTDEFYELASEVSGLDLRGFFDRHVRGVESPPYDEALGYAGLRLLKTPAREPFLAGILIDNSDRQNARINGVRPGSAAERAGLQQGDVLASIGDASVTRDNWRNVLNKYKPGERVPVSVRRYRATVETTLEIGGPELFDYRIEEIPEPTASQLAIRRAWLEGR